MLGSAVEVGLIVSEEKQPTNPRLSASKLSQVSVDSGISDVPFMAKVCLRSRRQT